MYIFDKYANEINTIKCEKILNESINFKKLGVKCCYHKDYTERAQIGCINMVDIFSLLIKEAGRICERYSSDIIYDINDVELWLKERHEGDCCGNSWCFGFRKYGVDSWDFVKDSTCVNRDYYKVYRLDIYCEKGYIYASLYEAL